MLETKTEAVTGQHSEKRCALCACPVESWHSVHCSACAISVGHAEAFNGNYFRVPSRYAGAQCDGLEGLESGQSLLLYGGQGGGKTHAAYALLLALVRNDPRVKVAAYSWPEVLMELRKSYGRGGRRPGETESTADFIIDALRQAHAILLDDLAAEKISENNQAWVQEILFTILDHRWAWKKRTVLTTNLKPNALAAYLGDRLTSRITGMCEVVELAGPDRRLV